MNSLELLKILIEKLEQYESTAADKSNLSLEGFQQTLQASPDLNALKNSFLEQNIMVPIQPVRENNIERVISQQILFLYRYIKYYSRTAFSSTQIKSIEEFSFMATAMQYQSISKTDLIKKNVTEKSSGIEIIKRLIKSGFLSQMDNPDDLRSQLVTLTDIGKRALFQSFEKMHTLGHIATGELTDNEKEQLAIILKKLDTFHYENYLNKELHNLEDYLPASHKGKE